MRIPFKSSLKAVVDGWMSITLIGCRPKRCFEQIRDVNGDHQKLARYLLAANLRRLRSAQGLSQEQLAERAGVHRNYLGRVERREQNVGLDNLERIARALNISVSELLNADLE